MPGSSDIIDVHAATSTYRITVQRGLLADVGTRLRELNAASKAIVITDTNIPAHDVMLVKESLEEEGFSTHITTIPAGEANKSIEQICKVYDQILPMRLDRSTPLIALGGGMIGDMTGFVAATVLRGVPFVQVPTTLLAMVDASVGGKTGVNHSTGKNLIGSFNDPIAVFIDPDILRTLPPRELQSGLAECIKHEVIRDAEGFTALEANIGRAVAMDFAYLAELIAHNVRIKSAVVAADPFERGERAHLNFGHTFGHAIETTLNYALAHGQCVALGMTAASFTAKELGLIDEMSRQRIVSLIAKAGLPTSGVKLNVDTIVHRMNFDKKVKAGKVRHVLPDRIGHVVMRDDVPIELIRSAVEHLVP